MRVGGGSETGDPGGAARPDSVRAPLYAGVLAGAVVLKLALHVITAIVTPYGLQRDEFLYLAMGTHLHLWHMDFPPAMALISELMRATVGVGVVPIRLVPAVGSTLLVILAVLFARELGGRRLAQALAALTLIASPAFLRSGMLFQPVVFDQVAWSLALLALVKLARRDGRAPRWWLALGAALGVGLLVKFSIAIVGAGIFAALLLLPARRWLATPWPWVAALLAFAIGAPSIVGQMRTGWPALAYEHELAAQQLVHVSVAGFFASQAEMLGAGAALAVAGLWAFGRERRLRVIAVAVLVALAIILGFRGKSYYLLPVYPALVGAGAAWLERMTRTPAGRRGWAGGAVRWALFAVLTGYGALMLPFGLPILPPAAMARYAAHWSRGNVTTNQGRVLLLPQDYADMLHWRERVLAVARVYDSLPPAERAKAVIAATNYGEAGAIDYYGPALGLPRAVCGCGSYWFFGPGMLPGDVLVTIGVREADLRRFYRDVTPAGRLRDRWAVPEEQDVPLFVATGPAMPLQALWPLLDPRRPQGPGANAGRAAAPAAPAPRAGAAAGPGG